MDTLTLLAVEGGGLPVVDFAPLVTMILQAVGSIIVAVLVVKVTGAYFQRSWGVIVLEIAAFCAVGYFIWFNDASVGALQGFVGAVTGAA